MTIFQARGFPLEIYEYIISFISKDIRTLKACSLTCRAFVPATRTYIFRTVRIFTKRQAFLLTRLLELSEQASSQLHNHVHSLDIGHPVDLRRGHRVRDRHWLDAMLPSLLRRLPCIETLRLVGLQWHPEGAMEKACIAALSSTVTALHFIDTNFASPQAAHEMLLSFPYLHQLRLNNVAIPDGLPSAILDQEGCGTMLTSFIFSNLGLFRLHLRDDLREVVSRFLEAPYQLDLKYLDWESQFDEYELQFVGQFLRRGGPLLQRLFLHFECLVMPEVDQLACLDHLSIGSNTNLTTIRLDCRTQRFHQLPSFKPGAWVPLLLSQLTPTHLLHLRTIEIDLRYTRTAIELEKQISFVDWDTLDDVLSNLALHAIDLKVIFLLGRECEPWSSSAAGEIRGHLPKTRATDIPLTAMTKHLVTTESAGVKLETLRDHSRDIS